MGRGRTRDSRWNDADELTSIPLPPAPARDLWDADDDLGAPPPAPPAELSPALRAWDAVAGDWAAYVRAGDDPLRRVTDRAILDLVRQVPPGPVLDAGCGEGWLTRELAAHRMDVTGVDGAPRMVALASAASKSGDYRRVSFAEAADEPRRLGGAFGTVIFNFSLLDERITPILAAAGSVLFPYGRILIQTAHPFSNGGGQPGDYRDGWRLWDETAPDVEMSPAVPWYFRTLTTWVLELRRAGLLLVETSEPLDPVTGRPASLILHATIPERHRK